MQPQNATDVAYIGEWQRFIRHLQLRLKANGDATLRLKQRLFELEHPTEEELLARGVTIVQDARRAIRGEVDALHATNETLLVSAAQQSIERARLERAIAQQDVEKGQVNTQLGRARAVIKSLNAESVRLHSALLDARRSVTAQQSETQALEHRVQSMAHEQRRLERKVRMLTREYKRNPYAPDKVPDTPPSSEEDRILRNAERKRNAKLRERQRIAAAQLKQKQRHAALRAKGIEEAQASAAIYDAVRAKDRDLRARCKHDKSSTAADAASHRCVFCDMNRQGISALLGDDA
jgi:hypothetical protein